MDGGWILNQDFDEGNIMPDFDCEDFTALTNPACSPSEMNDNPSDILSGAWKETFAKLKALQNDQHQNNSTVTLGSGFTINDTDEFQFEKTPAIDDNDMTLAEEFQFETGPAIDFNDSDYETDIINHPDNDCPCCSEKFRYRYQVIDHLERKHNRCPTCQYKFETAEDLHTHKLMKNCGEKDDYYEADDDNLSISGDEDTCTLSDMLGNDLLGNDEESDKDKLVVPDAPMFPMPQAPPPLTISFDLEQEDSKDEVWREILEMEEQLQKSGNYRAASTQPATWPGGPAGPVEPARADNTPIKKTVAAAKTVVKIKEEPMQPIDDNSFEFESTKKGPIAKIKPIYEYPDSLLKKRLRPTLATKVRGRYGRATLKPHGMDPKSVLQPAPAPVSPVAKDLQVEEPEPPPVVIKEEPVEAAVEDLEGELTCAVCELTVEGFLEMETHAATHTATDTNGVNCVVCDTFLESMTALSLHEKEKHSLFAYKCGDCNKIFNSQSSFKDHEKYHNNFKQCPMCDKKFPTTERLQRHQDLRCQLTDCKCVQCNMKFPTIEALRAHKETHGKNVYRCDKCGKEYDQKQTLAVHKMSHTGEEKPFKCKVCGKGFKTYWYYVVHEKCYCKHIDKNVTIHPPHVTEPSKKKFYQCKICCRVFPHISHLKVHNYIHTGERPYKCNSCGKGFTQKQNLKVHERVHTGEKPYICNDCGFGFKDLGNLRRHQYVHTGEKPHGCDICSKRFTWVESLRRHKRTHLKQRPYECKICKREFVHHGHLRIHELVHKDEKPFQCNICGKAFTMLSSLSIHEHIHLERKPYPCDMCQRTFMTASALTTHKQSHVQRMANAYRQAYRDRFSF